MSSIDIAAQDTFLRDPDPICGRDRAGYLTWDALPPGLQQWYRDRAARYAVVTPPLPKDREER